MPALPDRPHLRHLKRQAKELLDQLLDDDDDAVLSDAQRLVAQTYGFRTWSELRDEVARRGGTT
jgi:hypothetical protein